MHFIKNVSTTKQFLKKQEVFGINKESYSIYCIFSLGLIESIQYNGFIYLNRKNNLKMRFDQQRITLLFKLRIESI